MTNTERIRQEIERRLLEDYNSGNTEIDEVAQGVCAALLYFIDSLPKEAPQGWISIKDRLPEESGFYFTCVNPQGTPQCVGVTYFDATRRGGEWIEDDEDDEDNCIADVDYWMPIPKFKEK